MTSRPHLRARQVATQSLGTHQENAVFVVTIALGCVVAPNSATDPSAQLKKADVNLHKEWDYFKHSLFGGGLDSTVQIRKNPWWTWAESAVFPANFFVVAAHGNKRSLSDYSYFGRDDANDRDVKQYNGKTTYYQFDKVVAAIDAAGYDPHSRQPILIAACWAGSFDIPDSLCQRVANYYGVEVVGFSNWMQQGGPWGGSPFGEERKDGVVTRQGSGAVHHFFPE